MTQMGVNVRMTDQPVQLEWAPILVLNNYSKLNFYVLTEEMNHVLL